MINEHKSWGNKFIDNLAADIKLSFPNATGYSARNLKYMAKFAAIYPDFEFVQQVVAQIPWGHNVVLMDKISDDAVRKWYIKQSIEHGWSRNILVHQIESGLYERQVIADKISNFENRLASPQSELAVQTMKDPYVFDFIPFKEDMVEGILNRLLYKILLNYYWSLEQVSLFSEISITSMSTGMTSILTYYFTISTSAAM